ncbi:unnamed protein product, partial [Ectocarpus sp. 8 AP-2014]
MMQIHDTLRYFVYFKYFGYLWHMDGCLGHSQPQQWHVLLLPGGGRYGGSGRFFHILQPLVLSVLAYHTIFISLVLFARRNILAMGPGAVDFRYAPPLQALDHQKIN